MISAPAIAPACALAITVLATAGQLGACATANLDCGAGARRFTGRPAPCSYIPPGASNDLVEIGSSPTPAAIYVDGNYVGKTPLKRYLWFSSTTRAVTVVAEPLYPGQARQEQRVQVPPLPRRLTFFMNNPAKSDDPAAAVR